MKIPLVFFIKIEKNLNFMWNHKTPVMRTKNKVKGISPMTSNSMTKLQ